MIFKHKYGFQDSKEVEVMIFQHQFRLLGGWGYVVPTLVRITERMRLWYSNISPDYKEWGYGIPTQVRITRDEVMVFQHHSWLQGGQVYSIPWSVEVEVMVFQHQSGLQGGWDYGILTSVRITRRLRLWYSNINPDYMEVKFMVFHHQSGLQGGWGYGIPTSVQITDYDRTRR